jgi:hypothetical protein
MEVPILVYWGEYGPISRAQYGPMCAGPVNGCVLQGSACFIVE